MNKELAVKLAKKAALAAGKKGEHGYLPITEEALSHWEPHEWVITAMQEAILAAANGTMQTWGTSNYHYFKGCEYLHLIEFANSFGEKTRQKGAS